MINVIPAIANPITRTYCSGVRSSHFQSVTQSLSELGIGVVLGGGGGAGRSQQKLENHLIELFDTKLIGVPDSEKRGVSRGRHVKVVST